MPQVTGVPPQLLLSNSRKSTLHRRQVCPGVGDKGVESFDENETPVAALCLIRHGALHIQLYSHTIAACTVQPPAQPRLVARSRLAGDCVGFWDALEAARAH